jgi:hypothetical protein
MTGKTWRIAETMGEGRAQEEFAFCLGEFIAWVKARGWRLRISECGVQPRRTGIALEGPASGEVVRFTDGVHRTRPEPSLHYSRRAVDVNLIVPGTRPEHGGWVTEGGSAEWAEAHGVWESLHPNCRFGNGKGTDDNHLSFVRNNSEVF